MNLVVYEVKKTAKVTLIVYTAAIILAGLALFLGTFNIKNASQGGLATGIFITATLSILIIAAIMMVYPYISTCISYGQDLNGKISSFESHLPYPAWQRLLAKYLVALAVIILGAIFAVAALKLSMDLLTNTAVEGIAGEMRRDMMSEIGNTFSWASMARKVLEITVTMFASCVVVNILISLHASIRNKVKNPILLVFAIGIAWLILLTILQVTLFKGPGYHNFNLGANSNPQSLGEYIMNGIIIVAGFFFQSHLLAKKVENP